MQRTKFSHEAKANQIIATIPKMDNLEVVKYKKFNDIGEFYQIIANMYLGYNNVILKFKIDTTTKKNAKVYCKARINDDFLEDIKKYYDAGKIVYPEYNIKLESFQDINGENHLNIVFLSKTDETINTTLTKMITIFNTITDNINSTTNTSTPVDTVINQVVNQIIETTNISTNTTITPIEPVVAPVVEPVVAPVVEPVVATIEPVVEPVVALVEPVYVPVPVCPPPFMPVFNELSPQSLDAERMHIYNLEMHINNVYNELEIMKKKHELRVKCYNDIVKLYRENCEVKHNNGQQEENWKENSEEEN